MKCCGKTSKGSSKVEEKYKRTVIGQGSVLSVSCVIYTGTIIGKMYS